MPERQREINALAGVETTVTGPALGEESASEEEGEEGQKEEAAASKAKGDVDSSSDEGTSEELSESEDEGEVDAKKAPNSGKKQSAK